MRIVRLLSFRRRPRNPVAANEGIPRADDYVAADGTIVKADPFHIRRSIAVGDRVAREQLHDRDAERFRDGLDQRDVRVSFPRFP